MPKKIAAVSGICGQDGFWLTKMLLQMGYEVHGFNRRADPGFLIHLPPEMLEKIYMHRVDVTDSGAVNLAVSTIKPQELYHLAAFSSVRNSWTNPEMTYQINVLGTLNILNAIKDKAPDCLMYFAGSSEQFGNQGVYPQTEASPMNPVSPYGISKLAAYHTCRSYRSAYKLKVSCGIAYNHDSIHRSEDFVLRKICKAAAMISMGKQEHLALGDLNAERDFGYAADFAKGYWQALQAPEPGDYVFATGVTHPIREICDVAFAAAGIPISWEKGKITHQESGITKKGKCLIHVSFEHFRPADVQFKLVGNAAKAKRDIYWETTKNFSEIIEEIVKYDLAQAGK